MVKPCIVLVGLDGIFVDEVLQGLTGAAQEKTSAQIDWTIDTKYYTADVHLCPLTSKMLVDESVANATEMLIILLDTSHVRNLLDLFRQCSNKHRLVEQPNEIGQLVTVSQRSRRL